MLRKTMLLVVAISLTVAAGITPAAVHERKEVAGMLVVFGAEPEPALTEEKQDLVWRFRGLESEEPVGDLEDLQVTVMHGEQQYGPFAARGSRQDPGTYRAMRIFTAAGDYKATLSFQKAGETERHAVEFDFHINDRAEFEIPGRHGMHGDSG